MGDVMMALPVGDVVDDTVDAKGCRCSSESYVGMQY
jgi:hypothetical protein